MWVVGHYHSLIETSGYKMIDVIDSQLIMLNFRNIVLSEKNFLKFPKRCVKKNGAVVNRAVNQQF